MSHLRDWPPTVIQIFYNFQHQICESGSWRNPNRVNTTAKSIIRYVPSQANFIIEMLGTDDAKMFITLMASNNNQSA